jgi:5'-3' exonuclease
LNDHTKMFDVQSNEEMDPAAMEAKLGYTPAEAIDVQTLMGDSTDNVPGVPGVGEKTAVKLIKQYGSAAAVLNHLDELTPKMRENFEKFGELMPITRAGDAEDRSGMEFDPEDCKYTGLNNDLLRTHFKQLGFTNLLNRLGEGPAAPIAKVNPGLLPRFQESLFGDMGGCRRSPADDPGDVPVDEGPPRVGGQLRLPSDHHRRTVFDFLQTC